MYNTIHELILTFKANKFDIVQYSTPNASFCASLAAKISKIKIRNYHIMGFRYLGFSGLPKFIFKFLEKLTCWLSTHIECITPSNLELGINEKIFDKEKATIVLNGSTGGVDLSRFDYTMRTEWRNAIRKSLGYSETEFIFGFVGRITKDKGINEILEAFSKISGNCNLLLIGNKEGINTLDTTLYNNAQKDPRIRFYNSVNDIEKYYAAIDVLLLPSYREGFGMVIAEAAAMGTPSIVSNIPGPIDVIIEGETALTAEVKNADDLRLKMQYFINNTESIPEMSQHCTEFIKTKFDSKILNQEILHRKKTLLEQ